MSSKIREAFEELIANIEMRSSTFGLNVMVDTKTFLDAKAALAEPLRNCDVGTAEEQIARFVAECLAIRKRNTVEPCAGCPCSCGGEGTEDCQLYWAQMPFAANDKGHDDGTKTN